MQFIPGSHTQGKHVHDDTYAADNFLHRGQKVDVVNEDAAVDVVLAPGEVSFHHGWALHASGPNPSNERRIGLTVQYLAPSVRQTRTNRESATLVRGVDVFGHFADEPGFEHDLASRTVAFKQEAERLKRWVYDQD